MLRGLSLASPTLRFGCCRSICTVVTPALQHLRQRQRTALQSLERDLIKMGAEDEDTSILRDAVAQLDGLFLLCIVGEFNSGKSSLINALCGSKVCAEGVLPTTSTITLLKHPSACCDLDTSALSGRAGVTFVDVDAASWLRDGQIVDTPGTNSLDASHQALTDSFLPRADLLIFVSSADRPFSESEAGFLSTIQRWRKKVIFAINKADLLPSADDERAVIEYVASHAAKACGQSVPVFPIASRIAFALRERSASPTELGTELRPLARGDAEARAAEQWAAFERYVLNVLGSEARAAQKLQSQLAVAAAVLGKYEGRQAHEQRVVAQDMETLAEARRRVAAWEAATAAEMDAQRARIKLVLHGCGTRPREICISGDLHLLGLESHTLPEGWRPPTSGPKPDRRLPCPFGSRGHTPASPAGACSHARCRRLGCRASCSRLEPPAQPIR